MCSKKLYILWRIKANAFFVFLRSLAVSVCHDWRLLESHIRKCFSNLTNISISKTSTNLAISNSQSVQYTLVRGNLKSPLGIDSSKYKTCMNTKKNLELEVSFYKDRISCYTFTCTILPRSRFLFFNIFFGLFLSV